MIGLQVSTRSSRKIVSVTQRDLLILAVSLLIQGCGNEPSREKQIAHRRWECTVPTLTGSDGENYTGESCLCLKPDRGDYLEASTDSCNPERWEEGGVCCWYPEGSLVEDRNSCSCYSQSLLDLREDPTTPYCPEGFEMDSCSD